MTAAVLAATSSRKTDPSGSTSRKLYRQLDELLPADVIIASSSSGLTMSAIQSDCPLHPERCVIAHPFNRPTWCRLSRSSAARRLRKRPFSAPTILHGTGKQTVRLRKEVPVMWPTGCNRIGAEVYYLVAEGVVSVTDGTRRCAGGRGLRWGIMGR